MDRQASLSMFHFLFSELIEECYNNHKEVGYLQKLKKVGEQIGYKLYTWICLRKGIHERASSLPQLIDNIQNKVFMFLFNYKAANSFEAKPKENDNDYEDKNHYYVIVDQISVYLTWMPEQYWSTSIFIAGIIQGILRSSGLTAEVTSSTQLNSQEKLQTNYCITIGPKEYNKWNKE